MTMQSLHDGVRNSEYFVSQLSSKALVCFCFVLMKYGHLPPAEAATLLKVWLILLGGIPPQQRLWYNGIIS